MSKLKELTIPGARPLPVIVLADVSGSMNTDGKIQSLNQAMKEMLESFKSEDDLRAEIQVAVLTFGGGTVRRHVPLTSAASAGWTDHPAAGGTPMGAAFQTAKDLLEDRSAIPGRAYRPTLVLLSDGQPTDEWKGPLKVLLDSERGGKAFRMALGIGADADMEVLSAFLNDPEARVFKADEARQIREFFRLVTMSVTSRSRSANPNVAPQVNAAEEWDL
ncbi:vWA domain-containing protein [Corallococcus sicarius]|uniref:VWA domain-containing protein n=1 Tax=Corallococcus sicarius TaxID=2316726 RepID=A0A3A8NXT6_9BACT|nr:VWA domain-containing protein [Corallococcus sicarius]RKH44294.1 VWA domain-containing protein [Corallococcus sicarius]